MTQSNSFDLLSHTELDSTSFSPNITSPFNPTVHSSPKLRSPLSAPITCTPISFENVSYPSSGPPSHININTPSSIPYAPSVDTPNLTSGLSYSKSKKKGNWRTLIINANGILSKTAEISAIIEYCDPDLMLISETKIDSTISYSEFLPKGYTGEFRRDRNKNGGGVMIVTKDVYTITDQ